VSYFTQTEQRSSSILTKSLFAGALSEKTNESGTVFSGYDDAAFATLTLLDSASFGYKSVASCEAALSSPEVQEVLRLQKKEVLTKAVEELRRRRQSVAAARHKAEIEVRRLSAPIEAIAPLQLAEGLFEHGLGMEAACLAEAELCRFEEKDAGRRLQESNSRATGQQQQRIKEAGRLAAIEGLDLWKRKSDQTIIQSRRRQ
jgi:hypothetical protein